MVQKHPICSKIGFTGSHLRFPNNETGVNPMTRAGLDSTGNPLRTALQSSQPVEEPPASGELVRAPPEEEAEEDTSNRVVLVCSIIDGLHTSSGMGALALSSSSVPLSVRADVCMHEVRLSWLFLWVRSLCFSFFFLSFLIVTLLCHHESTRQ